MVQDPKNYLDYDYATSDKNILAERMARLGSQAPLEAMSGFATVANRGIYQPQEIQQILDQNRLSATAMATSANKVISRGMRRTLGRRLGARSGAVDVALANQYGENVLPQLAAQQYERSANMMQQNVASRLSGLTGYGELASRYMALTEGKGRQKGPNWLGVVTDLAKIAEMVGMGA